MENPQPLSSHPSFSTPFIQWTVLSHNIESVYFPSNLASTYQDSGSYKADTSGDVRIDPSLYCGSSFDRQHFNTFCRDDNAFVDYPLLRLRSYDISTNPRTSEFLLKIILFYKLFSFYFILYINT